MTYFVQRFMGTHKSVQAMLAPASNSTPTTTGGTTTDSMSDFSGGGHDGNNNVATTTAAAAKSTTWQTTAEMKEKAFGTGNVRQATTIVGIYGPGGIGKKKKIHCFSSSHCSLLVFMLHMAFLIS